MTWTIEISLVDIIFRYTAGICAIVLFILMFWEQRKTMKFLREELKKWEDEDK